MNKILITIFIFNIQLYAKSNEDFGLLLFNNMKMEPFFYFLTISIFTLLLSLYFFEQLVNKTALLNMLGRNNKNLLLIFNQEITFNKLKEIIKKHTDEKNFLYVFIFESNRLLFSDKLKYSDKIIFDISNISKDINNEILVFKVPKSNFLCNFIFSIIVLKFFSYSLIKFIQFFTLRKLAVIFTFLFVFLYYIWENYFKSLVDLLGVPLSTLNFNITELVDYLLYRVGSQLTVLFSFVSSSFLSLLFTLIVTILILSVIFLLMDKFIFNRKKKNIKKQEQNTLVEFLVIYFYTNIFVTLLILFIIIFNFFKIPYMAQMKIENPMNKSIRLDDISLFYGDYFSYTKIFSIKTFSDKDLLVINKSDGDIYYHNIKESKNRFFKDEINTIRYADEKNVFNNCKEIIFNITESSLENKYQKIFTSLLLNKKIFSNIKSKESEILSNIEEREVTFDDLYLDEIFYKCKILEELSIDYKNEKDKKFYFLNDMSDADFNIWIDSFNNLSLTRVDDWVYSLPKKLRTKVTNIFKNQYDYEIYKFYIDKYIKEKEYSKALNYLNESKSFISKNKELVLNIEQEFYIHYKEIEVLKLMGNEQDAFKLYENLIKNFSRSNNSNVLKLMEDAKRILNY